MLSIDLTQMSRHIIKDRLEQVPTYTMQPCIQKELRFILYMYNVHINTFIIERLLEVSTYCYFKYL